MLGIEQKVETLEVFLVQNERHQMAALEIAHVLL